MEVEFIKVSIQLISQENLVLYKLLNFNLPSFKCLQQSMDCSYDM